MLGGGMVDVAIPSPANTTEEPPSIAPWWCWADCEKDWLSLSEQFTEQINLKKTQRKNHLESLHGNADSGKDWSSLGEILTEQFNQ